MSTVQSLWKGKLKQQLRYFSNNKYLYLLLLPCVIYFIIFNYLPMYGLIIAFKDFKFSKGIIGSPWCGLDNFIYLFGLKDFYRVFGNSFILSLIRLVFFFPIPIILALMLNEIPFMKYKRVLQTVIYLPYFYFMGGNRGYSGKPAIPFLGDNQQFDKGIGRRADFFPGQ